jgi:uncharacterized membrane protein YccC
VISVYLARGGHGFDAWRLRPIWKTFAPRVSYGLRLSASVCLALLLAFWLQLDAPYWAGTTASLVCQPSLGASLRKGRFRVIGTLVGAVVIVMLTAIAPQSRAGLLIGLALWVATCGFFASIFRNFAGYGAALAGYTAAVIFISVVSDPGHVFETAVDRSTGISIGVLAAGLVVALTELGDARARLGRALAEIGSGIATGLTATLGAELETTAMRTARRALIRRVIALDATIDEATGEFSHLRYRSGALHGCAEALFTALSAWRGVANHLLTARPAGEAGVAAAALRSVISEVADQDWLNDPDAVRTACVTQRVRAEQTPTAGASGQLLVELVTQALHALERVANGSILVGRPWRARVEVGRSQIHVPDYRPALLNALRVIVALLAADGLWIASAWPDGPTMIVYAAASVTLFSPRVDALSSAVGYVAGTAGALALAALVSFALLPPQDGFVGLCLVLTGVLTPLGVMAAGTWQAPVFTAAATNLIPILGVDRVPDYDAARLFNTGLAVLCGTIAGAVALCLIPPLSPNRQTQRLLALTLRDLRLVALGRRRFKTQACIGLISQRLAAMPAESSLEQEAFLLAGLSVGEAAIALVDARPRLAGREALDKAFTCLAAADVAGTRQWLDAFCARQTDESLPRGRAGFHAAVVATVIADAVTRHPEYFGSTAMPGGWIRRSVISSRTPS